MGIRIAVGTFDVLILAAATARCTRVELAFDLSPFAHVAVVRLMSASASVTYTSRVHGHWRDNETHQATAAYLLLFFLGPTAVSSSLPMDWTPRF
jgi:hypothetical protein